MILLAAQSAVETYGGQGGQVVARTHESALPMTGFEWVILLGIAVVVFVVGALLAHFAAR